MSMPLLLVLLLGLLSQAQNLSSHRPMSLKIAPCLLLVPQVPQVPQVPSYHI